MKDHCRSKITLYGKSFTGHHDIEIPKKKYKVCLQKSFSASHINHCWWSALAEDHNSRGHTINCAVLSFKDTNRATLKEKKCRRKNTTLCHQRLSRSSVAAAVAVAAVAMPVRTALASSVVSKSAINMDHPVLKLHSHSQAIISIRVISKALSLTCPVSWNCRIHWLFLCGQVRPPLTSVLNMTINNLMVRFH